MTLYLEMGACFHESAKNALIRGVEQNRVPFVYN